MYVYIYVYTYVYIYVERERERDLTYPAQAYATLRHNNERLFTAMPGPHGSHVRLRSAPARRVLSPTGA